MNKHLTRFIRTDVNRKWHILKSVWKKDWYGMPCDMYLFHCGRTVKQGTNHNTVIMPDKKDICLKCLDTPARME